jgi:hypothetical protein
MDHAKIARIADAVNDLSARFDAMNVRADTSKKMFELLKQLNQIRSKFSHNPFSQYEFESEGELKAELDAAKRAAQANKDPWMYGNRA